MSGDHMGVCGIYGIDGIQGAYCMSEDVLCALQTLK